MSDFEVIIDEESGDTDAGEEALDGTNETILDIFDKVYNMRLRTEYKFVFCVALSALCFIFHYISIDGIRLSWLIACIVSLALSCFFGGIWVASNAIKTYFNKAGIGVNSNDEDANNSDSDSSQDKQGS